MSAFIGSVNGPRHNSPNVAVHVSCSAGGVEVSMSGSLKTLDPIGARVLAALLIQASKESERMALAQARRELEDRTPLRPGEKA